jgi:lysozyme family protein
MQSNFETCLALMLEHEGGFVNHPQDPGGMTNLGVTKRVWEEWVGHEVDEKQMRALTPETVAPLYKRKYWDACRADDLVAGVDYEPLSFYSRVLVLLLMVVLVLLLSLP